MYVYMYIKPQSPPLVTCTDHRAGARGGVGGGAAAADDTASCRGDARDHKLGPPKRGVSKPTIYHFPQFPLCEYMPFCLGQWSATCFMKSRKTVENDKPLTVGLLTPLFGSTQQDIGSVESFVATACMTGICGDADKAKNEQMAGSQHDEPPRVSEVPEPRRHKSQFRHIACDITLRASVLLITGCALDLPFRRDELGVHVLYPTLAYSAVPCHTIPQANV